MTREQAKKLLPIIQAFSEGKDIETKTGSGWISIESMSFAGNPDSYRIKSGPKYRPFANKEECWKEMQKHQPFGWLISQNGEANGLIISIDNEGFIIGDRNNGVMGFITATDLFKIKFADGTPFGVKVEE